MVDDALPSECEDVDGNESVYYSSSEVCSNYSDTDEDITTEYKKKAQPKIIFNPHSKVPVLCPSMKF